MKLQLSAPIFVLRQRARQLARSNGIPLHQALDTLAREEGYSRWSLLVRRHPAKPAPRILAALQAGEMLLLAARPGQGKTMLALDLLGEAMAERRAAYFFTLEYNPADVARVLRELGKEPVAQSLYFDNSDDISAPYVIDALQGAPTRSLVVVDYLQVLDLDRRKPPVEEQIVALKRFAAARQINVVLISQVHQGYELSAQALPTLNDVRQPNPFDIGLFDQACFMHAGRVELTSLAHP